MCTHILAPTSCPISLAGNPGPPTSLKFGAHVGSNYQTVIISWNYDTADCRSLSSGETVTCIRRISREFHVFCENGRRYTCIST